MIEYFYKNTLIILFKLCIFVPINNEAIMEARELRIGNWVARENQPEGFIIDSWSFSVCEKSPEKYKPIPLTEEWLLKLGFTECSNLIHTTFDVWVIDNYMPHFFILKLKDVFYFNLEPKNNYLSSWGNPINYVHQLQNLYFALTGEELTLK